MNYYVSRSDGKTYGPFDTRTEAVIARSEYHSANTYRIVPVTEGVEPADVRECVGRVVQDPR